MFSDYSIQSKMKVLVAVESYPDLKGGVNLFYVHVRNMSYIKEGIDVTVLNFSAKEDYIINGIKVITLNTYLKDALYGDVLILHAANIRHHYRFVRKHGKRFNNFVFFFHGHEVLKCSAVYPKPYPYVMRNILHEITQDIYDCFKLRLWRYIFKKYSPKTQFVFVSNWMYNEFLKWVKLDKKFLEGRKHIIYNCIGKEFETEEYNPNIKKEYDLISVRSNFDGSKYGVDIVCRVAEENPELKICLVGRGEYFEHNKKPDNIEVVSKYLKHEELVEYLNKSRGALMPTRTDAQGVMACEMATFGIPLITSSIDVCKEVFEEFDNVAYIPNNGCYKNVKEMLNNLQRGKNERKQEKYFEKNTTMKEIALLKDLERHGKN